MIREMWGYIRTAATAVFGDPDKRLQHRDRVRGLPRLGTVLPGLAPSADLGPAGAPVFVFAPTWRCGSTLVQRLVMSTGEIWMWGEVYTRAGLLRQMVGMFAPFGEEFPDSGLFRDTDVDARDLTDGWIARLSPKPRHLLEAHRAFWDRLCARPARERGYDRWGMKEVCLGVDHAHYLERLYPDARFIFLVRNPYEAWLSYRRFQSWYASFPDEPVFTVGRFARKWADNVEQYLEHTRGGDGLLVRLEDLVRGGDRLSEISDHIGASVRAEVLDEKVSGTDTRRAESTTAVERLVLRRHVGRCADRLGYEPV